MTSDAQVRILGRMENASNHTLLIEIDGISHVYKPISGERSLWDFPTGTLAYREVAAFELSELLGWHIVPHTYLIDGPEGEGSVQRWVDGEVHDVELFAKSGVPDNWARIIQGVDEHGQEVVLAHNQSSEVAKLCLFDVLINNADRKGGHILTTAEGKVFGIDHGVTFHHENKLRTVLWGWSEQPIPTHLLQDVQACLDKLALSQLVSLISPVELHALSERMHSVLESQHFPAPSREWPAIPWPVF